MIYQKKTRRIFKSMQDFGQSNAIDRLGIGFSKKSRLKKHSSLP